MTGVNLDTIFQLCINDIQQEFLPYYVGVYNYMEYIVSFKRYDVTSYHIVMKNINYCLKIDNDGDKMLTYLNKHIMTESRYATDRTIFENVCKFLLCRLDLYADKINAKILYLINQALSANLFEIDLLTEICIKFYNNYLIYYML